MQRRQRTSDGSDIVRRALAIASYDALGHIRKRVGDALAAAAQGKQDEATNAGTEAYTLLQHIDWAHHLGGDPLFDLGKPQFAAVKPNDHAFVVEHGGEGKIGSFTGAQIADRITQPTNGLPDDWTGVVNVTSCYAAKGKPSVVQSIEDKIGAATKADQSKRFGAVQVNGYAGTTVTHSRFDDKIFVVKSSKELDALLINASAATQHAAKLITWLKTTNAALAASKQPDIRQLAADTAKETDSVYEQLVAEMLKQGVVDEHQVPH